MLVAQALLGVLLIAGGGWPFRPPFSTLPWGSP